MLSTSLYAQIWINDESAIYISEGTPIKISDKMIIVNKSDMKLSSKFLSQKTKKDSPKKQKKSAAPLRQENVHRLPFAPNGAEWMSAAANAAVSATPSFSSNNSFALLRKTKYYSASLLEEEICKAPDNNNLPVFYRSAQVQRPPPKINC